MNEQTDILRHVLAQVEINRDALVQDVVSCVRIPSVVGHEGQVQVFVADLFKTLGLELDIFEADLDEVAKHPAFIRVEWPSTDRPNVVGTLRGSDPAAHSLALTGHVDVVSPEPVEAWIHGPWSGDITGVGAEQRIYGRGALDMKAGTIAMFHGLKAVLDAGLRPRGTVIVQSVVEEEAGGGAGTLATLLRGHTADAMLNPEPFHRNIVLGQPGVMLFRISLLGKTAHAAYSQHGVNAIGKMLLLYQAMVELDAERVKRWPHPFWGGLSDRAVNLNIGTFHSGDWASTVAGRAEMECRVGFIPPQTMVEVRREVERRISDVAAADPWLREHPPVVTWFDWQAEPWRQDEKHPFVTTLASAVQHVTGIEAPKVAATAGLDTRFAEFFGMAAACIGPRGANMHGIDEYVEVESVVETAKIVAATIVDWCGVSTA